MVAQDLFVNCWKHRTELCAFNVCNIAEHLNLSRNGWARENNSRNNRGKKTRRQINVFCVFTKCTHKKMNCKLVLTQTQQQHEVIFPTEPRRGFNYIFVRHKENMFVCLNHDVSWKSFRCIVRKRFSSNIIVFYVIYK